MRGDWEALSSHHLLQQIAVTVQKGNAAAVLGTNTLVSRYLLGPLDFD